MPTELTERQREILEYIKQNLDVDGIPPTVREIQWQFGFKSPNAVQTHLLALTNKGYIYRRGREAPTFITKYHTRRRYDPSLIDLALT